MAEKNFPTAEDVALWDKYDATYGMDAAGGLRPGAPNPVLPMDRMNSLELLFDLAKTDEDRARVRDMMQAETQRVPLDDKRREDLMKTFIATRRSGVASLGFDPAKTVLQENEEKLPPLTRTLGYTIGDYTYTKRDPRMSGSTATHETMHRGIDQLIAAKSQQAEDLMAKVQDYQQTLRDSDKKPTKKELNTLERLQADALRARNEQQKLLGINPDVSKQASDENETVTRAMMIRNYGRAEQQGEMPSSREHYLKGLAYTFDNPEFLDEIEQLATDELRRRGRPMGPR